MGYINAAATRLEMAKLQASAKAGAYNRLQLASGAAISHRDDAFDSP